jgi:hypothetical protein
MASRLSYLAALAVWIAFLWFGLDFAAHGRKPPQGPPANQIDWVQFFTINILPSLPVADEFDTPLRPPDGEGVIISMPFLEQAHLGEDWITGQGAVTLGEPVYSVADGWVSVAQNFESAWGNVIFICYRLPTGAIRPSWKSCTPSSRPWKSPPASSSNGASASARWAPATIIISPISTGK